MIEVNHDDEPISIAYVRGQRDRRAGGEVNDNPYTFTDQRSADEWADGWCDEDDEIKHETEGVKSKRPSDARYLRAVLFARTRTARLSKAIA